MQVRSDLAGRDEELSALGAFVAGIAAGPRALILRGEPGIGKTALLAQAKDLAAAAGARVWNASGSQLEMRLGFSALGDLIEPALAEIEGLLEPQRRVLALAVRAAPADGPAPDRLSVCRSFLAALRLQAEQRALLIVVDDLQWLDAPSMVVLSFALRRLSAERVGVLAALRGGSTTPVPLELGTAFPGDGYREIVLGPLTSGALSHVVRRRGAGISRGLLQRVLGASGGNPLFALEFARSLPATERGRPPHLQPVPVSLLELIGDRVAAIPPEVKAVVELAAVLARPTPSLLRAGCGEERFDQLLGAAADAGTLTVTSDGTVRFTHPLIASAVYEQAPPSRRQELHRQAAMLTEDEEEAARHLALSTFEPDAAVAELLERAAQAAAIRGAPETAADLAHEALRLTPPAAVEVRYQRMLSLASFFAEGGDLKAAQVGLDPLLERGVPSAIRSRALIARSDCEFNDRRLIVDLLKRALDVSMDQPEVRWHALVRYAQQGGWVTGDADTAERAAREAVDLAENLANPVLVEQATFLLRFYQAALGVVGPTQPVGFAEMASVRLPAWQVAHASSGPPLMWAGELAAARTVFVSQYQRLVERGSVLKLPFLLLFMTELEWRAGDWSLATRYAEEAAEILTSAGRAGGMVGAYVSALMAASSGRVDEARSIASQAIVAAETHHDDVAPFRNRWVLGFLELSLGDPAAAWRSLGGLSERLDRVKIKNPGVYPFLPDAIEALIGLDRLDDAALLLDRLESPASVLQHRWAVPAAARSRGLLLLARGQTEPALAQLDAAVAGFGVTGHLCDLARSHLAAGMTLRRAGERRRAAERVEEASGIFLRIGAPLWSTRCEQELRRARPRPRSDHDLTSAEIQVARLVGGGRTNKEVAAEHYTTVATVEAHLTRIYRKLGVRSRTELTRLVMEGALPATPD